VTDYEVVSDISASIVTLPDQAERPLKEDR
jgi:hypothetical protein